MNNPDESYSKEIMNNHLIFFLDDSIIISPFSVCVNSSTSKMRTPLSIARSLYPALVIRFHPCDESMKTPWSSLEIVHDARRLDLSPGLHRWYQDHTLLLLKSSEHLFVTSLAVPTELDNSPEIGLVLGFHVHYQCAGDAGWVFFLNTAVLGIVMMGYD